jgi:hypothetical protein
MTAVAIQVATMTTSARPAGSTTTTTDATA